jgi:hypothetical protein
MTAGSANTADAAKGAIAGKVGYIPAGGTTTVRWYKTAPVALGSNVTVPQAAYTLTGNNAVDAAAILVQLTKILLLQWELLLMHTTKVIRIQRYL